MSSPQNPSACPRILFILGCGRSGSTILTNLLGSHPRIFGAGELCNLIDHGWMQGYYCSCGVRVPVCSFWQRVRKLWDGDPESHLHTQRSQERFFSWLRRQARPARQTTISSDSPYATMTRQLFAAVAEAAQCQVVVDASKSPFRLASLARIADLDLRVVHLIRDGRGVAYSLARGARADPRAGVQHDLPSRSLSRTARRWKWVNRISETVCRQLPRERTMALRYEDFAAAPAPSLARIGALLELDLSSVARAAEDGARFDAGHNVAGNRLRMQGPTRLKLDDRWQRDLPDRDRRRFERIAGSALRGYDYPIPPGKD